MTTFLPDWLTELLPEIMPPHVISMDGQDLVLTSPDGDEVGRFGENLKDLSAATRNIDVVFTDEVEAAHGGPLGLSFPASRNTVGMIMSHTDADRFASLERDFKYWLRSAVAYEKDPADFYNSYRFVDAHPAFWMARDLEKHPWFWETSGHASRLYQYVGKDNGNVIVGFETGCHVEPDFKTHYHDYRLDVYSDSFEAAYVALAAKVNKFYHWDGTERSEVDHIKPQWIIDLEDRVKDLEDDEDL